MMNFKRHQNYKSRSVLSVLFILLMHLLYNQQVAAQTLVSRTFPAGSVIVDMGSASPTVANSLKPYGLVYGIINRNCPVYWAISSTKAIDGIDFVYNGKSYSGGTFLISRDQYGPRIVEYLKSWAAQGVIIDYTNSSLTLTNLIRLNFVPKWTLDKDNGVLAVGWLNAAGIPSSAYSFKSPAELNSCDDIFVMPHAEPTWEAHRNLYFWNKNFRGNIWAGCNAVSILENISKDTVAAGEPNPIKMNYLSTTGLMYYYDHRAALPPYFRSNPSSAPAQYIGVTDGSQNNGAESIYLPKAGGAWNSSVIPIVTTLNHPDIPGLSTGPAMKNVFGRAFGDPTRGYVCYQAGHSINGSSPQQINAQRIFLNFSFYSLAEKAGLSVNNSLSNVPTEMKAQVTYTGMDGTATGNGGPFTYQWGTTLGFNGTFSNPNGAVTSFTPDGPITKSYTGTIGCVATDACGRKSISSILIKVLPGVPPLIANTISKDATGDCEINTVSFNVFDSNVDPDAGTRTLTAVSFSGGTATFTSAGVINYTSAANFKGTDAGTYTITNGTATTTGTLSINVGLASLAPSVTGETVTVAQDNVTQINVLANDKNNAAASNASLLYIRDITQKPTKGYVYINSNGTVSYLTKNNLPTGSDVFKYLACNDVGYCSEGVVNININVNACPANQYKAGVPVSAITANKTITVNADTYLASDGDFFLNNPGVYSVLENTSFGASSIIQYHGNDQGDDMRIPLIKMDVSALAPLTNINSANFELTVSNNFNLSAGDGNIPVSLYRLKHGWTEADASWNLYDATHSWDPNGVGDLHLKLIFDDPEGNASARVDYLKSSDGSITTPTAPSFDLIGSQAFAPGDKFNFALKDFVQYWVNEPANNFGMVVRPFLPGSPTPALVEFYSREASVTADKKPRIIINYDSVAAVSFSCVALPSNYKPIAYPDTASTKSNAAITIPVMNNDANYYGTLTARNTTITTVTVPAHGTCTILTNTQLVYTPSGNFVGIDTLTYTITDGTNGQTHKATVRITVSAVPPVINRDNATTASGTAVSISVTTNDTDPQGAIDVPVITVNGKNGSAVVSGNNIIYTPSKGYIGKDTLIYQRSSISTSICNPVLSDTALVVITMTNQPPVAVNDTVTTYACAPVTIKIKNNDNDPEGTVLTPVIAVQPLHGTVALVATGYKYTPTANYIGADQFTYVVKDGSTDSLVSNPATVVITVSGAANPNITPIAQPDNESTLINQPINTDVLANDSDPNNDDLTLNITAAGLLKPANGTIQVLANNMIRYIPNTDFVGTDTYEYQICDLHPSCSGSNSLCTKALVSIKVTPKPILVGGTIWDDANGSAAGTFNNIQNGAETGTNGNGGVYVYLIDSTNTIIDLAPVSDSGIYLLTNVPPVTANLKMILSNKVLNSGDLLSATTLPIGYTYSSPGIKTFTTGTTNITGSDFGIGVLPIATPYDFPIQLNPGALMTLDATKFTGTDEDGTIVSIKYTGFPTNVTSIEIGGTSYTAGTFPVGGVTVSINSSVKIFPVGGSVTPAIPFLVIDNSGSVSPISATVNVPLYVPLVAGTITGGNTFCGSGIPSAFGSSVNASGGQAAILYQWQSSSSATFTPTITDIPGANAATYTPSSAVNATTYYRRKVSTSGDAAIYSNTITITINPLPAEPVGVTATANSAPATVTISATATGGTLTETVDWYSAPTGGTLLKSGIAGTLTTSYSAANISNSTVYYAQAVNGFGCVSAARTIVSATISGTLNPGVIAGNQSGCGNFSPTGFTSSVDASGVTPILYEWQSSATAGFSSFTVLGNGDIVPGGIPADATSSTININSITATTYFRRRAYKVSGPSGFSNVITVTSNPIPAQPTGGSLSGARTGAGTVTLTGTVPAGSIIDWYSTLAGNGILLNGNNTYTTPSITQTTNYYPVTRDITTGCISPKIVAVATINPVLNGGTITGITSNICGSGTPGQFSSSLNASGGTGTYIYQWQSSTDNVNFTDITGANASTYTPSGSINTTTYYRRAVSTSTDAIVYSNSVVVNVLTLPNVRINPTNATITTGQTVTLTASGAVTYSWTPATNLSATNTAVVIASPITTTLYTVSGTDVSSCVNAATMTITVNPVITPGSIGSNQTICAGTIPAALTSLTAATGGTGTISYQWQSSTDNISFTDLAGQTAATYSPAALSTTTYFRRAARTTNDAFAYSVAVTITVNQKPTIGFSALSDVSPSSTSFNIPYTTLTGSPDKYSIITTAPNAMPNFVAVTDAPLGASPITVTIPASASGTYNFTISLRNSSNGCVSINYSGVLNVTNVNGGTIGSNQTLCVGATAATLSNTSPASGGSGIFTYQWQKSTTGPNSGFTDIPGAISTTYTPGVLTQTTYFRRQANDGTQIGFATAITITVNPLPVIAVSPSTTAITSGSSISVTASGAVSYSWSPATNLNVVTGASVIASPLATTTYTVSATDINGCINTGSSVITVNPVLQVGSIGINQTICSGTVPGAFVSFSSASGGTGTISYQWQSSTSSATSGFTDISGATSATYTSLALTQTTYFRRGVKTTVDPITYTPSVTVTVNPLPTVNVNPSFLTITLGNNTTLTASGASTYSWSPATGLSVTNAAVTVATPIVNTVYVVTGVSAAGCSNTANAVIVVSNTPVGGQLNPGVIAADQTICIGATPVPFTSTSNASGGTGNINYQWQSSTNNATFVDIAGATSSIYIPGALSQTTYFRRAASTSTDPVVYAGPLKVTTIAPPVISGGISGLCAATQDSLTTYSVTPATNATNYVWTLPNGWSGTSTTNTITVKPGAAGGTISVTPYNGTCAGNTVTMPVYVIDFVKVDISGIPVIASGNGNSPIKVTVTLFDANGNKIPCSGGPATLNVCDSSGGSFTTVVDNNDGTYTSNLTAFANTVTVCGTINKKPITRTIKLTFTGPQGGIKGNGPILATETPTITFTATEGRAPFTIIYKSDKSTKNDTLVNIISGKPYGVNLIPSTTFYTLLSIIDANGERRVNNFTKFTDTTKFSDTTTIIVLAPRVIITLKADPPVLAPDTSYATRLVVRTKNIGELDLENSQARLNLKDVFPSPVTYVLDSVRIAGQTVVPNLLYNGILQLDLFAKQKLRETSPVNRKSKTDFFRENPVETYVAPDNTSAIDFSNASMDIWTESGAEQADNVSVSYDGNSVYLFGALSKLPIGVEADAFLWLHIRPNGYAEPFVMQAVALGTGRTIGATALATSLSNDNEDVATHPEVNKKGEPVPTVVNLYPNAVVGLALNATTPVIQTNGTYNVDLTYTLANYGNLNLQNVRVVSDLSQFFGLPATVNIIGPVVTTGTLIPNTAYDGKINTNILAANSILGLKHSATIKMTININPNQLSAIYQLQPMAYAFSGDFNISVTDLSNDGVDPDPDANNIPSEKVPTVIAINKPIPPLVPGPIGIKVGTATTNARSYCDSANGVVVIPVAANTGGSGIYQYQWQSSADNISFTDIVNATDSTYTTGKVPVTYYLRRATISGNQIKYGNAVLVQIFAPAPKPVITGSANLIVGTANITLNSSPANAYLWSTGEVTRGIVVKNAGTFTVTVTDANACPTLSNPFVIAALEPTKVADLQKIWPKPAALQADGTFLVSFTFQVSNKRAELLDSIVIKDDLTKVFPASTQFEVVDIQASGKLIANALYNGKTQIDLLNNVSRLDGLKTDSIQVTLKVTPNGFSGLLNNQAELTAKSPYGKFNVLSNDPAFCNCGSIGVPTKFIIPGVDIFIPSGFSPNRDGVNDLLIITRPYNTTISLDIFNRWGNLVYKSVDYKNDWDGRGNQPNNILGEELPDGTYYYIVLATDKATGVTRKFAAYITLKR